MTSDVQEVTVHRPFAFLERQCHEMCRVQIHHVVVYTLLHERMKCLCFVDRELTFRFKQIR